MTQPLSWRRAWWMTRQDVRLQLRHGFYAAYAVVTVAYVLLLRPVEGAAWDILGPLVLFTDPAMLGFFFVGGSILLEQQDGALDALFCTPARSAEYLAGKVASLTALALLACLAIGALVGGVDLLLLAPAAALTSAFGVLVGVAAVSRASSVTRYFMISALFTAPMTVPPMLDLVGWAESVGWLALPTGASMRLFVVACGGAPRFGGEVAVAFVSLATWTALAAVWASRWFERYALGRRAGAEEGER